MPRVGEASGVTVPDQNDVKADLYRTLLWHFLADDRLGPAQTRRLATIREALGIMDDTTSVVQQFQRIRGLTPQTLPRPRWSTQLGVQEHCLYETRTDQGTLHLTN